MWILSLRRQNGVLIYPVVGWWLETEESTAGLVMRAHQQRWVHFQALRHFCAALNFGKVEPRAPTGPRGGEKIAQARKASLRLQHPPARVHVSYDENSSCPKGENRRCPPRRYNQRRSDGACSSGKDLPRQVSASVLPRQTCSVAEPFS